MNRNINLLMLIVTVAIIMVAPNVKAQTPSVRFDSLSKIKIGEQTRIIVQLPWDGKSDIIWPVIKDSIGKIEIVQVHKLDTLTQSNPKILSQAFTITAFDSGVFTIPSFAFEYAGQKDSNLRFRFSDSLWLTVTEPKADTTKAIKDIKDIESAPITWEEIFPWLLGILSVIIIAVLSVWLYRKYKRKEPLLAFNAKPKLPAHEIAIKELEEIRRQRIWQQGKIKEFHTAITDTLRNYIEERFNINAKEMISDDIKLSLAEHIDDSSKISLSRVLDIADMVKFAKAEPLPDEHDSSLQNAIVFVHNTKEPTNEIQIQNKES